MTSAAASGAVFIPKLPSQTLGLPQQILETDRAGIVFRCSQMRTRRRKVWRSSAGSVIRILPLGAGETAIRENKAPVYSTG